jgi:hypothetical protein
MFEHLHMWSDQDRFVDGVMLRDGTRQEGHRFRGHSDFMS